MCPVQLYNNSSHYLINTTIFGEKKLLNVMSVEESIWT